MTAAGDAYPFAGGVRFFTRERGNVGQATKGFAEFNIVGSVGCGMINACIQ
jgi:hypothetical protein